MYHDSYEYNPGKSADTGEWSADFLEQFTARRGYKLVDHLPAMAGIGLEDTVQRIRGDYRETVSDLMIDGPFARWVAWSHEQKMLTRYQAHGSPGNLLDLYALSTCLRPRRSTPGPSAGDEVCLVGGARRGPAPHLFGNGHLVGRAFS